MTGKGQIALNSNRRWRLFLAAHLTWLGVVCLLGGWWGTLLLRQAYRIFELESQLGISRQATQGAWQQTQRMLLWEASAFFLLLLVSTGFLFWVYWRDVRRSRSIQAFFAAVTHELRTPMTSIRLQAESIAEGGEDNPSRRLLLDRLLEDTLRLESQVEKTLELARVEGGGPLFTQPIALRSLLDHFIEGSRGAHGSRVEFYAWMHEHVRDLNIEADSSAIQVILRNIVENSLRHSRRDRVKVDINARPQQNGVCLTLKDDGLGFQGDFTKLGTLFGKGPASQGAGVGLYLVDVLMRRMGGMAEFRTDAGSGFEVSLWFREGERNG